ncbi:hypothetical protein OROHE_023495 [Orobanche hederae]
MEQKLYGKINKLMTKDSTVELKVAVGKVVTNAVNAANHSLRR